MKSLAQTIHTILPETGWHRCFCVRPMQSPKLLATIANNDSNTLTGSEYADNASLGSGNT